MIPIQPNPTKSTPLERSLYEAWKEQRKRVLELEMVLEKMANKKSEFWDWHLGVCGEAARKVLGLD